MATLLLQHYVTAVSVALVLILIPNVITQEVEHPDLVKPELKCTFDDGFCGWERVPKEGWRTVKFSDADSTGYAVFSVETTASYNTSKLQKGSLISPVVETKADVQKCLVMWYYYAGGTSYRPHFDVYINEGRNTDWTLLKRKDLTKAHWKWKKLYDHVTVPSVRYQLKVTFIWKGPKSADSDFIRFDNIQLFNGSCYQVYDMETCTDGYRCGTGRCIPNSLVCDGEDDCGDMGEEDSCAVFMRTGVPIIVCFFIVAVLIGAVLYLKRESFRRGQKADRRASSFIQHNKA